jgi:hypothetical protein
MDKKTNPPFKENYKLRKYKMEIDFEDEENQQTESKIRKLEDWSFIKN